MEIIKLIEELLPIQDPFYIKAVLKDEEKEEVHIEIGVDKTYRPNEICSTIRQYYNRSWEHTKIFQYRCFLHCQIPIYDNKQTGKTEALKVEFSRSRSRFTLLYEKEVIRLMGIYYSPTLVARQLKVNPQRIESIYHFYTSESYDNHIVEVCEKIGIDETSTRKGHDYITIFVNMETFEIIDIQDGKSAQAIEGFFHNHANPPIVKEISVDMSPAFGSGFKTYFPWARLTFDKWHVFKLLGKHLEKLKNKFPSKRAYLALLFEHLQDFYQHKDWLKAKAHLAFTADFADEIFGKNSFSKSIRRHFDGIVEHIRSNLTNGVLEGINSKVQTIKRIAKGFRYTDNLKKMILFAFGIVKSQFTT